MTEYDFVFDGQEGSFLHWKVKEGVQLSPGTVLFVYKTAAGLKERFRFAEVATVLELVPLEEGQPISLGTKLMRLKSCMHPVVMKDMCADCGQDLRKGVQFRKEGRPGERVVGSGASVAMIHSVPELHVTEEEAKQHGSADEKNLIDQRKLVLLVDLDQTLIHTTNEDVDPTAKDVFHFQLYGPHSVWYHTRLRPRAAEFLKAISSLYELHICTFGARLYAHTVAAFLDPERALFRNRILSRDECFDANLKTANLKALFPCGDHLVCVIDDREDVWSFARNLVHVKPYRFFRQTGDINAPPGLTKTDRNTEHQYEFPHPHTRRFGGKVRADDEGREEKTGNDGGMGQRGTDAKTGPGKEEENKEDTETESGKLDEIRLEQAENTEQSLGEKFEESRDTEAKPSLKDTSKDGSHEGDLLENNQGTTTIESNDSALQNKQTSSSIKKGEEFGKNKNSKSVQEESNHPAGEAETNEDEDDDDYLYYLEEILKRIHKAFYQIFDKLKKRQSAVEESEKPDLKTVIPYVKRKVLSGTRIVFSGVIPVNQDPETSPFYKAAEAFGAIVQAKLITGDGNDNDDGAKQDQLRTTHVVASSMGTEKAKKAYKSKNKIYLVSPDWLWCCVERWERVDEHLFPVPKELPKEANKQHSFFLNTSAGPSGSSAEQPDLDGRNLDDSQSSSQPLVVDFPTFSHEQLRRMTDEVDDALSDAEDDEDDTKIGMKNEDDRNSSNNDDDDDSLSGNVPLGWKRRAKDLALDQDLAALTEGGKRRKIDQDVDRDENESDDQYDDDDEGESLGSVDDEMAQAVEREFASRD